MSIDLLLMMKSKERDYDWYGATSRAKLSFVESPDFVFDRFSIVHLFIDRNSYGKFLISWIWMILKPEIPGSEKCRQSTCGSKSNAF